MLTINGIPNCDTCRKARRWVTDNSREHNFHDLRENGLDNRLLDCRALDG